MKKQLAICKHRYDAAKIDLRETDCVHIDWNQLIPKKDSVPYCWLISTYFHLFMIWKVYRNDLMQADSALFTQALDCVRHWSRIWLSFLFDHDDKFQFSRWSAYVMQFYLGFLTPRANKMQISVSDIYQHWTSNIICAPWFRRPARRRSSPNSAAYFWWCHQRSQQRAVSRYIWEGSH